MAAYAFVALGTRAYGADAFSPVSVVWTFWALSVAVFTFPVQHWIIRIVKVEGGDASVRKTLPRLTAVAVVIAIVMLGVALPMRERLFGTADLWWPLLIPVVSVGSAVVGYGRGILASRNRFVATGIAIGAENAIRLLLGLLVVAVGGSIEWFGATLAGGVLVVVFWPSSFRLSADGGTAHKVLEFLTGLGGGILLAQVALNAPPAVIAAMGGAPAAVTGVFAALALFRAPYLVALGFATRLTGPLTGYAVRGDEATLGRIRTGLLGATAGVAVAVTAGAWFGGPWLVDAIFGAGVSPARGVVALIGGGSTLALGALGLIMLLLARDATLAILGSWSIALAVAIVFLVVGNGEPVEEVVIAFVITEVIAVAAMAAADRRLASEQAHT